LAAAKLQVWQEKKLKMFLNVFTGICYVCTEKGHWASHCNKESKDGNKITKDESQRGKWCNHCGKKSMGRQTDGSCLKMWQRGHLVIKVTVSR